MEHPTVVVPRTSRALRDSGVSKHLLDGPTWRRTSPGRYVPAAVGTSPEQRIAEAAAHMPPGSALGGWSSAYASGATWLDGLDSRQRPLPVVMCLPPGLHRTAVPGIRYVRQALFEDELVERDGVTFVSPSRTATDLARWAPDLTEAVVALDLMLAAGVVDLVGLDDTASSWRGLRGAKRARAALGLARPGVRSPGETRLRMAYVLGCDAPDVLVNPVVTDVGGRTVGMPDVLDEEAGLALEYDGSSWDDPERPSGHRDRDQHREDNVREEGFERLGLIVCRADGSDVTRFRTGLVWRLNCARMDGLGRDRRRDRWRVLHERSSIPNREASRSGWATSRER